MNDHREPEPNGKETNNQQLKLLNKSGKNKVLKSHTCDVCAKEFKKKDHLTRHKYIHLNTKPFSCEVN